MDTRALFEDLAGDYVGKDGVSCGQIWHNDGLKVNDKIFAMMVNDRLVVKVPATQAAAIVEGGAGLPFEPQPGRKMREWVVVDGSDGERWRELIADAYAYGTALTGGRT